MPELAVAVAEEWQGCGVGRALLALLERSARAEAKCAIELSVAIDNARGCKVYDAAGYEMIGRIAKPDASKVEVKLETHMARIFDIKHREGVLDAMRRKRERHQRDFMTNSAVLEEAAS